MKFGMQQVQLASIAVQIAMKLKKEDQEPAQTHTQRTGTHLTRIRIKPDASEALD